jgi:hypothetical protein
MPSQEVDLSVISQNLEIVVLHTVPSVNDLDHIVPPAIHGEGCGSLIGFVTRVGGDFDVLGKVVLFHGSFLFGSGQAALEPGAIRESDLVEKILKLFDDRDLDLR